MNCIQYNSVPTVKSSKRKSKNPVSQLAEETFEAFQAVHQHLRLRRERLLGKSRPLYHQGRLAAYRRYKEGERGLTYPDGRKFNPFLDIVANIYSPRHVHRHIEGVEVTYYTSGRNGRGLLYLDIDAHQPWQTDEHEAKRILQDLFPFGYFRASRRGQNGYLKIRYDTAEQFNDLADHLEATLRQLFLTKGILCDIEIKGKITTKDKSGSLAKSPFTTARCPCHKRDETDDWNDDQLQKFKNCPTVNVRRVEFLVNEIEAQIDEDKAAKFAAHKKSLDERANPERELVTFTLAKLGKPNQTSHPVVEGLIQPFIRAFQRREGRLPTAEEVLEWLKETGRYKERMLTKGRFQQLGVQPILTSPDKTVSQAMYGSGENGVADPRLGRRISPKPGRPTTVCHGLFTPSTAVFRQPTRRCCGCRKIAGTLANGKVTLPDPSGFSKSLTSPNKHLIPSCWDRVKVVRFR